MRNRKYRDERNSRRNRRWLQDEIDASGPLSDNGSIRQACSDTEPIIAIDLSTKVQVAAAVKFPDRLVSFKEYASRNAAPPN